MIIAVAVQRAAVIRGFYDRNSGAGGLGTEHNQTVSGYEDARLEQRAPTISRDLKGDGTQDVGAIISYIENATENERLVFFLVREE